MLELFPEVRKSEKKIAETLKREEESFNKTLDKGIELFEREVARISFSGSARDPRAGNRAARSRTFSLNGIIQRMFRPGSSNLPPRRVCSPRPMRT